MDGPARVLEYVKAYKRRNDGTSPSLRQICAACRIPSTSTVMYYLIALEKAGRVRLPGGVRNIQVVGGKWVYEEAKI